MIAEQGESPPGGSRRSQALKVVLGIAISAAFLYATLATVDLGRVFDLVRQANLAWIGAGCGFVALAYVLKTYRWTTMLRILGARFGLAQAAVPFMGGVAFNNVLPFRAGDIIRVVAFQRFTGIPPAGQLGTLALERLLDLFVLMAILFVTVSVFQIDYLDETLLAGARLAAVAIAVAIVMFIAAPQPIRFVVRWAEERIPRLRPAGEALLRLSDAVSKLSRPSILARAAGLSILAWLAEGGAYYAIGQALGIAPSVEIALLALSVGTLSTMIPSSPGYVGTFHYFTASVIAGFGASQAAAAAYAISIHALLWLLTTACGFLLLISAGLNRKSPAATPSAGIAD